MPAPSPLSSDIADPQSAGVGQTGGPASKSAYRPDIDGLRAIAIVTVVIFHAFPSLLPGGFVGVDVFFVISGFLITGLLFTEVGRSGGISLSRFYARRIRRLLPLSAIVLVSVTIASVVLLPPLSVPPIAGNVIAAALYVSNMAFASQSTDYMAAQVETSPVLHYWSLSVEEQYYLVWPLMMIGLLAWARRKQWTLERSARAIAIALAAVGAASLAFSIWLTYANPPWAFFSLPSRMWELAAGGGLALALPALKRMPRALAVAAGWLGLALIVWACLRLSSLTPYPGTAALVPVAGTALVIAAGARLRTAGAARLLSEKPMVALGLLSYSWYLWHWPFLVFTRAVVGTPSDEGGLITPAWAVLLAVLASLAVAWITHRLVEDPVRHSRSLATAVNATLVLGLVLTLIPVGTAWAARSTTESRASAVSANGVPIDGGATAVRQGSALPLGNAAPIPLTLSPADAASDDGGTEACLQALDSPPEPSSCRWGDPNGTHTLVLLGDSHAANWAPALDAAARKHHWKVIFLARSACPMADVRVTNAQLGGEYTNCAKWRDRLVELWPQLPSVDALIVARSQGYKRLMLDADGNPLADDAVTATWAAGVTSFLSRLSPLPRRVVVVQDTPWSPVDVPQCLSAHTDDARACDFPANGATHRDGPLIEGEKQVGEINGTAITLVDLTSQLCPGTRCPAATADGQPIYRDKHHLTATVSRRLADALWSALALKG